MAEQTTTEKFASWAILELMGHRRLAGYVTEEEIAGASLLRIDIPLGEGEAPVTQFYSAGAIYCITPTTEETARRVAAGARPEPVHAWELPAPSAYVNGGSVRADDDEISD